MLMFDNVRRRLRQVFAERTEKTATTKLMKRALFHWATARN